MAADATGIREFKGAAKATTIVAGINNASTSFSIADSTGWPTGSVGNFVATLEQGLSTEERILCSGLAGGVLTVVTRGYDNTTAVAHATGSSIAHTISALDIAEGNYIANFRSQTGKTTPADADVLPLNDVAGGNVLKSLTWANLKATLKTYFDTLYARFNGPTVNTQTASYVLVASDVGKRVVMNSASATTITVNTSLFGAADTLEILNIGAGVCTITAGTATVSTAGTLALVQNAGGKLYFTSAGVSVFIPSAIATSSGGMTLLESGTLSGAATTSGTLSGAHKNLYIIVSGITLNTTQQFGIEPNSQAALTDTVYMVGPANAVGGAVNDRMNPWGFQNCFGSNANNECVFTIYNYADASHFKAYESAGACSSDGTLYRYHKSAGHFKSNTAITTIKFACVGSTTSTGAYAIYGVD